VIALASLRAGDVASGFAAWPNRSFSGAFAIAMLYQAVLRYLDASSTDARWRIHPSSARIAASRSMTLD